ncbi:MAG: MmcQ/YjbR family DNA-binding protein [Deltaproteobacteria bacterium]|nr:MmcQ/YjbR family DNA-binding protein [Deltaproteobacteria bacterium]
MPKSARPKPPAADPRFARVVAIFAEDPQVTIGGKGFGASALKVRGKIFAMMSSRGQFVVKLPKERVSELVKQGQGRTLRSRPRSAHEGVARGRRGTRWLGRARA